MITNHNCDEILKQTTDEIIKKMESLAEDIGIQEESINTIEFSSSNEHHHFDGFAPELDRGDSISQNGSYDSQNDVSSNNADQFTSFSHVITDDELLEKLTQVDHIKEILLNTPDKPQETAELHKIIRRVLFDFLNIEELMILDEIFKTPIRCRSFIESLGYFFVTTCEGVMTYHILSAKKKSLLYPIAAPTSVEEKKEDEPFSCEDVGDIALLTLDESETNLSDVGVAAHQYTRSTITGATQEDVANRLEEALYNVEKEAIDKEKAQEESQPQPPAEIDLDFILKWNKDALAKKQEHLSSIAVASPPLLSQLQHPSYFDPTMMNFRRPHNGDHEPSPFSVFPTVSNDMKASQDLLTWAENNIGQMIRKSYKQSEKIRRLRTIEAELNYRNYNLERKNEEQAEEILELKKTITSQSTQTHEITYLKKKVEYQSEELKWVQLNNEIEKKKLEDLVNDLKKENDWLTSDLRNERNNINCLNAEVSRLRKKEEMEEIKKYEERKAKEMGNIEKRTHFIEMTIEHCRTVRENLIREETSNQAVEELRRYESECRDALDVLEVNIIYIKLNQFDKVIYPPMPPFPDAAKKLMNKKINEATQPISWQRFFENEENSLLICPTDQAICIENTASSCELVLNGEEESENNYPEEEVVKQDVIDGSTYDCCLCTDKILDGSPVTYCEGCSEPYHTKCITPWLIEERDAETEIYCPKCLRH